MNYELYIHTYIYIYILYIYIYIYIYIYEHEAIQKPISENNIGVPNGGRRSLVWLARLNDSISKLYNATPVAFSLTRRTEDTLE